MQRKKLFFNLNSWWEPERNLVPAGFRNRIMSMSYANISHVDVPQGRELTRSASGVSDILHNKCSEVNTW